MQNGVARCDCTVYRVETREVSPGVGVLGCLLARLTTLGISWVNHRSEKTPRASHAICMFLLIQPGGRTIFQGSQKWAAERHQLPQRHDFVDFNDATTIIIITSASAARRAKVSTRLPLNTAVSRVTMLAHLDGETHRKR